VNSAKPKRDQDAPREILPIFRLRSARIPMTIRYTALLAPLVVFWQAYVTFVDQALLPGPLEVAVAFWDGWISGRLASATWTAIGVLAIAMLIGALLAAFLAVFAIRSRVGDDSLSLLAVALGPIPAIAVLPLLVVFFDAGTDALILVAVCAVVLPVATNLRVGLLSVNPTLLLAGQNLGLRGWSMLSEVLLPAALPHAIYGLRTGWARGWRTVIAAGLVFGIVGNGPGFFTDDAGGFLPVPDLFAGLLTVAFAGILAEATFGLLERRTIVRWGMKSGP
jgi:NitT/TauT family transport system permease protein